ncbi:uncharacterized protein L201_003202 [Kwoniella dendrophila CBS 6074]|uniref:Uncharacterized protein n=1 Tax=Kwoniella dendrophila CBS 6074 TaxID=1295534 RepID=A0AAX4JTM9_9TREE
MAAYARTHTLPKSPLGAKEDNIIYSSLISTYTINERSPKTFASKFFVELNYGDIHQDAFGDFGNDRKFDNENNSENDDDDTLVAENSDSTSDTDGKSDSNINPNSDTYSDTGSNNTSNTNSDTETEDSQEDDEEDESFNPFIPMRTIKNDQNKSDDEEDDENIIDNENGNEIEEDHSPPEPNWYMTEITKPEPPLSSLFTASPLPAFSSLPSLPIYSASSMRNATPTSGPNAESDHSSFLDQLFSEEDHEKDNQDDSINAPYPCIYEKNRPVPLRCPTFGPPILYNYPAC